MQPKKQTRRTSIKHTELRRSNATQTCNNYSDNNNNNL